MRKFLSTASALVALAAVPTAASAQCYAADVAPPVVYAPAPGVVVNPPAVYGAPPMVGSQVYLAPQQTYIAPGTEYQDQAIYVGGQRYYRDCWWDWGQRRCELKRWW